MEGEERKCSLGYCLCKGTGKCSEMAIENKKHKTKVNIYMCLLTVINYVCGKAVKSAFNYGVFGFFSY